MKADFHDHHTHLGLYAALGGRLDLSTLKSDAAIAELRALPDGGLNLAYGWRTQELVLSDIVLKSLPPVVIIDISLHSFVVSWSGLRYLREIDAEASERSGDPIWREKNVPRLFELYSGIAGLDSGKTLSELARLRRLGLSSVEDMTVFPESLRAFAAAGRLDDIVCWSAPDAYLRMKPDEHRLIRGLKIFLDGSIGGRTAALSSGFSGRPGISVLTGEEIDEGFSFAHSEGKDLAIHAIGDLAIEEALAAAGRAIDGNYRPRALRIEHAQFIDEAQARRCRDYGITLCMQPNFNQDSRDYLDRLTPADAARNNPFRMLIDRLGFTPGVDLVFGSDGMPHGVEAACDASTRPVFEGQRMSEDEVLSGYRRNPARFA